MTGNRGEQAFNPSLWRQRRTFLLQILSEHGVQSVQDPKRMFQLMNA
jgi:hypothetical protein